VNPFSYLEYWSTHPVGQLHVGMALLALVLGPVMFLRRKGTLSHRVIGYVFVVAMLVVNITALTRYGLTGGFNFFHVAAILSLATLLPAIAFAWRARLTNSRRAHITHGVLMSWTYFGLVMALVSETVTRKFPYLLHGEGAWMRFYIFLGLLVAVTGWATNRLVQRRVVHRA